MSTKVERARTVRETLAWLERRGTKRNREGMARYGIAARKVLGVSMATMQPLVRRLGRDHALAADLWKTGWYEARILAAFVDEPARVTAEQMDRWARALDNWAICDTLCFRLFDRTPHAWRKVAEWATRREEFVKRAGFALLASLAARDRDAPDEPFLASLRLIERGATDDRNFVKKGVSWALRTIGQRSVVLNGAATALAQRLAASESSAARWVGRDALREFERPLVRQRLARRVAKRKSNGRTAR